MLIGYMPVSTGEQSLDLQRDALARVGCERVYDDVCSGRAPDRPGLSKALDVAREGDARPRVMTKPKLKVAMAMMADRENAARDVATQLGVSLSTLYAYVDAKGRPRERAAELLGKRRVTSAATAQ